MNEHEPESFGSWVICVREPAQTNSEGLRRIAVPGAEATYEMAPLPNGKWAMRMQMAYTCGNCTGFASPWREHETRQEALETFLVAAREHFAEPDSPTTSTTFGQQSQAQREMLEALSSDTLFGFVEPDPEHQDRSEIKR